VAKKVLLTGANGMLARDIRRVFERSHSSWELVCADRSSLEITSLSHCRSVLWAIRPFAVINAAAYTNVDKAETERELAMAVNALGPRNLAIACEEIGAQLLHISTDYVFDGEKSEPYEIWDMTNPINTYGKSKMWGEKYVQSLMSRWYVVRTSWLYGAGGRSFVKTMLELAAKNPTLRVVNDQHGAPTYTLDLAEACLALLESGAFGLYHATNSGITTWYGFAVEIMRQACTNVEVLPISTSEFPRPAKRPKSSSLSPYPLREAIGYLLPEWRESLERYLTECIAH
jgi:dTDP-4-dehydrorhamnose reductase